MLIYCTQLSKNKISTVVTLSQVKWFFKNTGTNKCIVRNLKTMSEKTSQSKTYVAVNTSPVGGTSGGQTRGNRIFQFFRRKGAKEAEKSGEKTEVKLDVKVEKPPRITKSDLSRLFDLAKPEKWRLASKFMFYFHIKIINLCFLYKIFYPCSYLLL